MKLAELVGKRWEQRNARTSELTLRWRLLWSRTYYSGITTTARACEVRARREERKEKSEMEKREQLRSQEAAVTGEQGIVRRTRCFSQSLYLHQACYFHNPLVLPAAWQDFLPRCTNSINAPPAQL